MSILIDKLKKQSQTAAQPIGFRASRPEEKPVKILIIARVEKDIENIPLASIEGADAILIRPGTSQLTAKTLQKIAKPLRDMPWGVILEDTNSKQNEALVTAGCDFVVFSPASPVATIPQEEKTGKILHVESSMDDGLLMAINRLPVDAVLAADSFEGNDALVWHQLMIFQHLTNFIAKPVIVTVPASISETELKALWDAGIDAVLVDIDPAKAGELRELSKAASKLPPRAIPKREKMEVRLPRTMGEAQPATPPGEEEEEDE